jgi:hypothetical protein
MTVRQFNKLETLPPTVVSVHFVPGKGWMIEAEERRFQSERRIKQVGIKKNGTIYMRADEFHALNKPHPVGFVGSNLFEVNFGERRKQARRRVHLNSNETKTTPE